MTSGLCIIIIFDSLSFVSTSYTQEQGDDVAGDDNYHPSVDDAYDDYTGDDYETEEFVLEESGVDLESLSMSMSMSLSMSMLISDLTLAQLDVSSEEANEEELVQETGGEMRLRGAAKHNVYKAIS